MSPTNVLKARFVVNHLNVKDCEKLVSEVENAYFENKHYDVLRDFMEKHYREVNFYV